MGDKRVYIEMVDYEATLLAGLLVDQQAAVVAEREKLRMVEEMDWQDHADQMTLLGTKIQIVDNFVSRLINAKAVKGVAKPKIILPERFRK